MLFPLKWNKKKSNNASFGTVICSCWIFSVYSALSGSMTRYVEHCPREKRRDTRRRKKKPRSWSERKKKHCPTLYYSFFHSTYCYHRWPTIFFFGSAIQQERININVLRLGTFGSRNFGLCRLFFADRKNHDGTTKLHELDWIQFCVSRVLVSCGIRTYAHPIANIQDMWDFN